MSKAKQPSKRQREMAARYCDVVAFWFFQPPWVPHPWAEWANDGRLLGPYLLGQHVRRKILMSTPILCGPHSYREAAAWLRSGEDLP